jgi:8-oxo-dGTP diphosphatase
MACHTPIDVVCAVIGRADGRVLAARRPPDKAMGGLWEFPGGKIEPEEEPRGALAREIREELGTDIEVDAPLAPVCHDYGSFAIRLLPFRCRLTGPEPMAAEHPELRWVTEDEAARLEWAPADIPVLAEAWAAHDPGVFQA